jgi:hypothetical protein
MFRWFLDATNYWFGYSDNSSTGSYDPTRECFVVLANDQANAANSAEAGDGEVPPGSRTGPHQMLVLLLVVVLNTSKLTHKKLTYWMFGWRC